MKDLPTLKQYAGGNNAPPSAHQSSTGRDLFMNIKNSAMIMANRSSSLAPIPPPADAAVNAAANNRTTELPRHSSVSKPTTNNVSPRMAPLEAMNTAGPLMHQSTQRSPVESNRLNLNALTAGGGGSAAPQVRRSQNERMMSSNSSADREASPI